jgi:8-oxo-dGTP pyrophosphatase MutT (NUDIX family)
MSDLSEPIPAATLVLMRERPGGPPELLVMERTGHMVFAAGALVFPGGGIDAAGHEAATPFSDFEDAAARIAAVRETIEETGIVPAISPAPDPAMAQALREGIARDAPFSTLLTTHGLSLDLEALTPFARWCPSFREARRFDTFVLSGRGAGRSRRADDQRA